jgi:hypothetical protein
VVSPSHWSFIIGCQATLALRRLGSILAEEVDYSFTITSKRACLGANVTNFSGTIGDPLLKVGFFLAEEVDYFHNYLEASLSGSQCNQHQCSRVGKALCLGHMMVRRGIRSLIYLHICLLWWMINKRDVSQPWLHIELFIKYNYNDGQFRSATINWRRADLCTGRCPRHD